MAKKRTSPEIAVIDRSAPKEQLAEYDAFVDTSPQGIMYCKTWWLDALSADHWEVWLLKKGEQIKAGWPQIHRKRRGKVVVGMPKLTQKLGILFAPSEAKYAERLSSETALTQTLIEQLPTNYVLQQSFHENFTNWLPFFWAGFRQTTRYTYIIDDLGSEDVVWGELREAKRRAIRKALKSSIAVREINDVAEFYAINEMTFARQGLEIPYSCELVASMDDAAQRNAGRRMIVAEDASGRVHACDYTVFDQTIAVSILAGADPEVRQSGAQVLLEWDSIKFAMGTSKRFDFEGSMIPGIENYMRGFGARQYRYFAISGTKRAGNPRGSLVRKLRGRAAGYLSRIADAIRPN